MERQGARALPDGRGSGRSRGVLGVERQWRGGTAGEIQ